MGTRGYVFIRCRGRYFVYYNHWDSYPEGLGEAIIAKIPTDPEKYHEWLESMRKTYSRLCQLFEEYHLPVQLAVDGQDEVELSLAEQHAKSYLALDDRLESAPVQTLLHDNDLFIEWTYTIDLDRELLGVNDSIFFKLENIPHGERWSKFFNSDNDIPLSEDTPQEVIGSVVWKPEIDSQARARYKELSIKMVSPKAAIEGGRDGILRTAHHHLLLTTFQAFYLIYRPLIEKHILRWKPDCFSFREIAFSLLSLAAGEVTLEFRETLNCNYESEGYSLIPDERIQDKQQKLLPLFLKEIHLPENEPGSAPMGTSFWFENVLVYLASRLDLVEVEEASVAKAVDTGLGQGLKSFFSVVFSIVDFVLIQVHVDEDECVRVQRSPLMNLFYFCNKESRFQERPRSRSPQVDWKRPTASYSKKRIKTSGKKGKKPVREFSFPEEDERAFVALMHFFDAAANHNLMGARSKIFPNEILGIIMQFSDYQTSYALSKSFACCRDMRCRTFPLNSDYTIVSAGADGKRDGWILEDRQTGERINSVVHYPRHQDDYDFDRRVDNAMKLNPVIGASDTGRQSIMDGVILCFPSVIPKNPLYTKEITHPVRHCYHHFIGFDQDEKSDLIFNIPEYAYPGFVEVAWGRYIKTMVPQDPTLYFTSMDNGSFPCLLPNRQRRLQITIRSNGAPTRCLAIIHTAKDESPEKWEKAQREITQELSEEVWKVNSNREAPGCLVIVAFGTRVKVFFYTPYTEVPSLFESNPNNKYSARIIASFIDPDPSDRLFQLIPGPEPFDILENDARTSLEYCIRALNGGETNCYYLMKDQKESAGANDPTPDNDKAEDVDDMETNSVSKDSE